MRSGEDTLEKVYKVSVTGVEVCVTGCNVNGENVVEFGGIVTLTLRV